jgi:peptidyl-prolyl cis-trans isomerase D
MPMLKTLRSKKTAKKIWITLAIVVIPAFCLWGFGSALRGREKPSSLGKIFGRSISLQEYAKNYRAVRNQYLIQLGQEQLAKLEKYLNLETQTWDRIIQLAEARRRKIRVSNKEVVDLVKQSPLFQSEGKFNPVLYREIITYVFRTSPRQFEEETRDNLTIAKLYSRLTGQITLSDDEIREAYEKENEQISLEYIGVRHQDFLDEVSTEKQELLDYYNANFEQFSKPLSYNLEYIRIENKDKSMINEIMQLFNQGFSLQEAAGNTDLEVKETGLFSANQPIPQIGWSTEILNILSKLKPKSKAWPQPIQADAEGAYFV